VIPRRLLALAVAAAACTPSVPTVQTASPGGTAIVSPTAAATTSPSPAAAFVTCDEPNPNTRMTDAVTAAAVYAMTASGFTYVQVLPTDPNSPPRTARVQTTLDMRYVAPDRVYRREEQAGAPAETSESIAIASDLWVRTDEGWELLSGGANPANANALAALIRDAGPGWKRTEVPAAQLPGDGCAFSVRIPVSSGGKGYRDTIVRADRATGLPSSARVVVRDAIDPFGNRHDTNMLYRVTYGFVEPIEPPESGTPAP
jgi:hypothetical protein